MDPILHTHSLDNTIIRSAMYRNIFSTFKQRLSGRVLVFDRVSVWDGLLNEDSDIIVARYPEYNICDLSFPDNYFDVIISDQVLEHIYDPLNALVETARLVKPGGICIHTTCFVNPYHQSPEDYWRVHHTYFKKYYAEINWTVLNSAGHGNIVLFLMMSISARIKNLRVPSRSCFRRILSDYNDINMPIVTWVVAQKPLDR